MLEMEATLRSRRASGGKCLVPYLTGGLFDGGEGDWVDVVRSVAASGADGIEVGIPFSDPVMDGPVIQRASDLALAAGATKRQAADIANYAAGVVVGKMGAVAVTKAELLAAIKELRS